MPENLSLLSLPSVYFVGIKGVGMTSLAVLLAQAGVSVEGADTEETFVTDEQLAQAGITPEVFSQAQVPAVAGCVIYSGAHRGIAHPLVQSAIQQGIPVLSHAQALGLLTREKSTVGVCGVGGKSTTTSLLAWIFERAGLRPSFSVGVGTVPNLGCSGRWSGGEQFFIEADEYVADPIADVTPRFLYTQPHDIICTSLSFDHPDVYESVEDTYTAFSTFFAKRPSDGWLVYNGDDDQLSELVKPLFQKVSVGEGDHNDVQLREFRVEDGVGCVTLHAPGFVLDDVRLASIVPGMHNLRNAAYAAVLASLLGVDTEMILHAVLGFRSTPRRFEYKGTTFPGLLCYDDYAHHPREIAAIAQTLRAWFPEKTPVVAFQPHTFSRTKALFSEFCDALESVGGPIFLLPIFASAREAHDPHVSSQLLENELEKRGVPAAVVPDLKILARELSKYDERFVFITLGAGDIYKGYEYVDFA